MTPASRRQAAKGRREARRGGPALERRAGVAAGGSGDEEAGSEGVGAAEGAEGSLTCFLSVKSSLCRRSISFCRSSTRLETSAGGTFGDSLLSPSALTTGGTKQAKPRPKTATRDVRPMIFISSECPFLPAGRSINQLSNTLEPDRPALPP